MELRKYNLRDIIPMPANYVDDPLKVDHQWPFLMGVELELEDVAPAAGAAEVKTPRGWKVMEEGSLRNGMEFVFSKPYDGDGVDGVLKTFYNSPLMYTGGPRTSTHIHVNARDLTVGQAQLIMAVSYAVETALFAAIKAPRKWCGYCMPLSEMSATRLRRMFTSDKSNEFNQACQQKAKPDRYYGVNINSLQTHGSLEFRYFPGAPSREQLTSWMTYVVELRKMANTTSIEELFSVDSPQQLAEFITRHMPTWGPQLLAAMRVDEMYEKLHDLMCLLDEAIPEENLRRDPLLFLTPPLIQMAARIIGKKYGDDNLTASVTKRLQALRVLSAKEWQLLMYDPHHGANQLQRELEQQKPAIADPIWEQMFYKQAAEPAPVWQHHAEPVRQDPAEAAMDAYAKMQADAALVNKLQVARQQAADYAKLYAQQGIHVGPAGQKIKPFKFPR